MFVYLDKNRLRHELPRICKSLLTGEPLFFSISFALVLPPIPPPIWSKLRFLATAAGCLKVPCWQSADVEVDGLGSAYGFPGAGLPTAASEGSAVKSSGGMGVEIESKDRRSRGC